MAMASYRKPIDLPVVCDQLLGQACASGCCCRCVRPAPAPLEPPCYSPPFPVVYQPRPICKQQCNTPPACWCPPCVAPPPCCRPGAYNPRFPPPGCCPPPCNCLPCKTPPRCMPPPCQPCQRPCCPKPVLLPVPAWYPNPDCPCPGLVYEYPPAAVQQPREPCKQTLAMYRPVTDDPCDMTEEDKNSSSIKYKSLNINVKVTDETRANPEPC